MSYITAHASSAEAEIIICDLHSPGETVDCISHLSYLKSILGLVNPRDLWKHRYQNAYGFENIIQWKQRINSFLLENHKATFYDYV